MKKLLIALFVTAIASVSFAQGNSEMGKGKGKRSMDERKTQALANIDKRISSLNELKTCISGATEKGQMKACREQHQARVKSIKE